MTDGADGGGDDEEPEAAPPAADEPDEEGTGGREDAAPAEDATQGDSEDTAGEGDGAEPDDPSKPAAPDAADEDDGSDGEGADSEASDSEDGDTADEQSAEASEPTSEGEDAQEETEGRRWAGTGRNPDEGDIDKLVREAGTDSDSDDGADEPSEDDGEEGDDGATGEATGGPDDRPEHWPHGRNPDPDEPPTGRAMDDPDVDLNEQASDPSAYDPDRSGEASEDQAAGEGAAFAEGVDPATIEGDHAPDDEEQPLEVHVTEMVHRLLAVAVVILGVAAIALLWSDDLINFLWYSFLGPGGPICPGTECPKIYKPHLYHPLSLLLARLKIAVLVGFVVGLPIAVYQTYLFMRPGLYPRERRYYLAAVPTSLVLAAVGVAFAYLLILPALFSYFVGYTTRAAEPALGLAETFNIIVILLGFFALVFQIPLLVMLAIMMGVTTRRWLEDRRLYFWMGFGGVAFIFSPDPTGMAPLLVALTMIGLFEGTLLLLRWTGKDSPILAPEPMRARRRYAWIVAALVGYAVSTAPLPTSYYGRLPDVVTDTIATIGWTAATPLIVAVAIVVVFEVLAYLIRQYGVGPRIRLWLIKIRWPWWVLAAAIGYLASPDPGLLEAARATTMAPPVAAAVALGIAVLYEIAVQLVVWRRGE